MYFRKDGDSCLIQAKKLSSCLILAERGPNFAFGKPKMQDTHMAKNYFKRYVWLIDLISRHGYISMDEINRAWRNSPLNDNKANLSERTFHNHKKAIEDTFGLVIDNDRTLGYYISNSGDLDGTGARTWLLQSLSLNNVLNESSDMKDRILIEQVPSSQKFLTDIICAMREGKVINMTYQSFSTPEPHSFDAAPYCVKLFRQRWYMLAKTPKWTRPRVYALDRIIDMEQMDRSYSVPENFDAEAFFDNFFGIIVSDNGKPQQVRIRVDEDQVKYYRSLPLHHSQQEIINEDGSSDFTYSLVPTFDFWQELLSKGDTIEVLEPAQLRGWMKDTVRNLSEMYLKEEEGK